MILAGEKANLITSCETGGIYKDNVYFPTNCGIQLVLNLFYYFYQVSDTTKNPNPVCIACKPGYKPTLSSSNIKGLTYKYITVCELIENCKSSTEFNKCLVCNDGYVLKYQSDSGNNWQTLAENCVLNSIEGCEVGLELGRCY